VSKSHRQPPQDHAGATASAGGLVEAMVIFSKGDVNGHLRGGGSATQMNTPLEFLIKTPDGVDATEFQLVHLHQKSDAREFRTVTGGVFHASGGASRNAIGFDQTKVARHTYKVTLSENLPRREYAFLAPGLTGSSASGATGKAYTFAWWSRDRCSP
jgi:hypothetical protein